MSDSNKILQILPAKFSFGFGLVGGGNSHNDVFSAISEIPTQSVRKSNNKMNDIFSATSIGSLGYQKGGNGTCGANTFSATSVQGAAPVASSYEKIKTDAAIDLTDKYKTQNQTGGAAIDTLLNEMKLATKNDMENVDDNVNVKSHSLVSELSHKVQQGGKGNTEMLKSMAALNMLIAKKANIKFPAAMKLSKHYRDEARKILPNGDIIALNKEAMKLVEKDASSGKINSLASKQASRQSRTKKSKKSKKSKNSRTTPQAVAKATGTSKQKRHTNKKASSKHDESSISLVFVTDSE